MACWNVIDHTEFSGSANYYEKTSIPSTYDHLCFKASARSDISDYYDFCNFEFNGDTTAGNYASQFMQTFSSGTPSVSNGTNYTHGGQINAASSLADTFGVVEIWIPNYANTVGYKQVITTYGAPNDSATSNQFALGICSSVWESTAAINAFKYMVYGGSDNMVQYSTFTLYGINGAA
tara:strand:+ start:312 stop:845 length:534 start_codon:yes stop_codon:yes gene_type:complete